MKAREYRTTVQPLWRNCALDFTLPEGGVYFNETHPLMRPNPATDPEPLRPWRLHSVQPLPMLGGEPKLLVIWERDAE